MVKIKKVILKLDVVSYIIKCPVCKKNIVGSSLTQAEYNFKIHKMAKHKK
jgi:phage FluMu protein Com